MWVTVLIGVAVGLAIAMLLMLRQAKGYRMLFSDTHLAELAEALAGLARGPSPTTFEGITAAFETLPRHTALVLTSRRALAPTAAQFLLAFARELAGRPAQVACLALDKRRCALVWERAAMPAPAFAPLGESLPEVRAAAADGLKELHLTAGSLAAYR